MYDNLRYYYYVPYFWRRWCFFDIDFKFYDVSYKRYIIRMRILCWFQWCKLYKYRVNKLSVNRCIILQSAYFCREFPAFWRIQSTEDIFFQHFWHPHDLNKLLFLLHAVSYRISEIQSRNRRFKMQSVHLFDPRSHNDNRYFCYSVK